MLEYRGGSAMAVAAKTDILILRFSFKILLLNTKFWGFKIVSFVGMSGVLDFSE